MKDWTPGIGGCGGAFFYALTGELVVEVEKRDRHLRQQHADLRAILFGPDRRVIQDATVPDDGLAEGSGLGPAQSVTLKAQVDRPGVYGMMVIVSNDRYGDDIVWRFRTTCEKFLIETSGGHRDARHLEPIRLLEPERAADVCFLPGSGAIEMDVSDLADGVAALTVFDAAGNILAELPVSDGVALHTFEAGARDNAPWRLHLPKAQGRVAIDGVTRWDDDDPFPNFSLWSPKVDTWFDLHVHRWLITPYHRTVYGRAGDETSATFQLRNNAHQEITVDLALEFPEASWPVRLIDQQVQVAAGETRELVVYWTVPDDCKTAHLRATTGSYSTYVTLLAQAGEAPASGLLKMPIELRPFAHENTLFGYLPDYPVENQVYCDADNQPFIRVPEGIMTLRNGEWQAAALPRPVSPPQAGLYTKIAFDSDGDVYMSAMEGDNPVLLHSRDHGKTFQSYPMPEGEGWKFDIEQFSGHNVPVGPPPIMRYKRTQSDPGLFWRRFGDLELLLPKKTENGIEWDDPVFISDKSLGLCSHSGIPSSVVSRGSKVHVCWGEATEPDDDVPGVPAFAATYDREIKKLSAPSLIGYGAPPNDTHNTPCITMDSQGYLHVLTGTHGSPFHYSRSNAPNDPGEGWSDPVPVGEGLRQTYIGLVCGTDDTLHLVFRLWRHNEEPFPNGFHATLAYMQKRPDEPWSEPRILVCPPLAEYSVWYHRLTIDHQNRLFLSYDYWSTMWFYRTDHPGNRRTLLMSPDGGMNWKLAETRDFE